MITIKLSSESKAAKIYGSSLEIPWQENITVKGIIERLNIESSEIGLIILENKPAKQADAVEDYCTLMFLPIVCGG